MGTKSTRKAILQEKEKKYLYKSFFCCYYHTFLHIVTQWRVYLYGYARLSTIGQPLTNKIEKYYTQKEIYFPKTAFGKYYTVPTHPNPTPIAYRKNYAGLVDETSQQTPKNHLWWKQ